VDAKTSRPVRAQSWPWWQATPGYQRRNLRWNPFGEAPLRELGEMAIVEEGALDVAPFQPLQIMAPAGHGKTTHLLALQARHRGAIYEYVPVEGRDFRTRPTSMQLFLLDEAQRVNRRQLRRLFASQSLLALGTHTDLQPYCRHPLRTLRIEALSLAKLRAIVSARLSWARADPGRPVPTIDDSRLSLLLQSHAANLRAILEALYDWFQHVEM